MAVPATELAHAAGAVLSLVVRGGVATRGVRWRVIGTGLPAMWRLRV